MEPLAAFDRVLLAVSGGRDSLALLLMAATWRTERLADGLPTPQLSVATVDHRLRLESAGEAASVAAVSEDIGLGHTTLIWAGEKPTTGIQQAARDARYRLLAEHAFSTDPEANWAVATGHTCDDQVETFLMRLARGSSLDGVAGMRQQRELLPLERTQLVRPLLSVPRRRLAAVVTASGHTWVDDPSNEDLKFERVKLRDQQTALDAVGLDRASLAKTVGRLASERDALEGLVDEKLRGHDVRIHPVLWAAIPGQTIFELPNAFAVRVLRRLVNAMGASERPAQLPVLEALLDRLRRAEPGFQQNCARCLVHFDGRDLWFAREPIRCAGQNYMSKARGATSIVWDNRILMRWTGPDQTAPKVMAESEVEVKNFSAMKRPSDVPAPIWNAAASSAPIISEGETCLWRLLSTGRMGTEYGFSDRVGGQFQVRLRHPNSGEAATTPDPKPVLYRSRR